MEEKTKVASMSVISNSFLTVSKVVIGVSSGSVSILSEGIHSGIDLFAAIIAFVAVRESGKPADDKHAYGHGKIENVSGTVEALLIFVAATWIMIEAFHKLQTGSQVESLGWGLVIMGLSAGLNLFVSTMLMRVAKKTDSVALEADALHLRTDVYTSAGVFIGLLLIYLTGWSMFDPLVAVVVAALIIRAAIRLTQEAFMPLVDASLPAEETEIIASIINKHAHEFVEFHKLRTRKAGAERHIDLHLVVPKDTSVAQVHDLCNRIENEIRGELHEAHVLIHSEPCTDRMKSCAECSDKLRCHEAYECEDCARRQNTRS